jgi:serine/threonine protein phosphatase PrpC
VVALLVSCGVTFVMEKTMAHSRNPDGDQHPAASWPEHPNTPPVEPEEPTAVHSEQTDDTTSEKDPRLSRAMTRPLYPRDEDEPDDSDTSETEEAKTEPEEPADDTEAERQAEKSPANSYNRAVTQPFHSLLSERAGVQEQEQKQQDEDASEDVSPETDETLAETEELVADPFTTAQADFDDDEFDDDTNILNPDRVPMSGIRSSQQGMACAALRDIGRVRQVNQDSVLSLLTTLPRDAMDVTLGLFVVADGMGGHDAGEVASRIAIRTIFQEVLSNLVLPAMDDGIIEALQPLMVTSVQQANTDIWEYAQSTGSDMGTTCTAVLMLGQAFYIAHVGDSRAYLLEAGGLRPLTADHSTVGRLIEMGQLDPAEARYHPLRNQLYRTIGQQPQVQVDFVYQPVGTGSHLLLCSDGLWGMVPEEEIEQILFNSPWPQDACNELIARANLAGGEDNISAVVVSLPMVEGMSL